MVPSLTDRWSRSTASPAHACRRSRHAALIATAMLSGVITFASLTTSTTWKATATVVQLLQLASVYVRLRLVTLSPSANTSENSTTRGTTRLGCSRRLRSCHRDPEWAG